MRAPVEPTERKTTRWKNNKNFVQQFILIDNDQPTLYKFAPGDEKTIPSIFDFAIQRVHNGVILGGEAPQLTNLDKPELKLAEFLDTDLQERKAAEAALVAAQMSKQKAEQEMMLAAARAAQAEKALQAADKPAEAEKKK